MEASRDGQLTVVEQVRMQQDWGAIRIRNPHKKAQANKKREGEFCNNPPTQYGEKHALLSPAG